MNIEYIYESGLTHRFLFGCRIETDCNTVEEFVNTLLTQAGGPYYETITVSNIDEEVSLCIGNTILKKEWNETPAYQNLKDKKISIVKMISSFGDVHYDIITEDSIIEFKNLEENRHD